MRYEHDAYKEFKERAPYKNTVVKLQGKEGRVVDYSMVKDSVLVQFGPKRGERELVELGRLVPENPNIVPADPQHWAEQPGAEDEAPMVSPPTPEVPGDAPEEGL